jgi:hypothetical protein
LLAQFNLDLIVALDEGAIWSWDPNTSREFACETQILWEFLFNATLHVGGA